MLSLALVLAACAGPAPGESGEPSALPDLDCAALPDVTYDNWGRGHLLTHCSGCHAAESPDRYGAPPAVTFDTEDETREWAGRIHARVVVDVNMPPAGGLTDDERAFLEILLVCGL